MYTVGKFRDFDMGSGARRLAKLAASLPIPLCGMHFCYDDLAQHILVNTLLPLLPLIMTPKFQAHFGTDVEVLYALRRFGIAEDSIPIINCNDERILDDHKRWFADRKEKDSVIAIEKEALMVFGMPETVHDTMEETTIVCDEEEVVPKPDDILFGHYMQHPGNIKLHKLLEDHAEAYELIEEKKGKMDYALKLVQYVKDQGSRFLIFDKANQKWMEVSDTKARLKVSKTIRNRRR